MVYKDADQDPELKSWFKKIDAYIRKCLKEQGYIMEDAATEEWNKLYDRGNFLLRDRYRNHTDRIVDEFNFLGNQFDADPLNKRFANSINKLFNDLGNDENGKLTFKPHLIKDLTEVILPSTFESIRYVPIPRIEYSDPMIDAVIENLVIESDNLMPNILEIANGKLFSVRSTFRLLTKYRQLLPMGSQEHGQQEPEFRHCFCVRNPNGSQRCLLLCQEEDRLPKHH